MQEYPTQIVLTHAQHEKIWVIQTWPELFLGYAGWRKLDPDC